MNKKRFSITTGVATALIVAANLFPTAIAFGYGSGGNGPISGGFSFGSGGSVIPSSGGSTGGTSTGGKVLGASTFNFRTDFGVGSRLSPDVTELQKILIADGFLKIAAPTGYFGSLTRTAVKAYQSAHKVQYITGFVGPLTRTALNAETASGQ